MSQQQQQPSATTIPAQQQQTTATTTPQQTGAVPTARNDPTLLLRPSPPPPFPVADSVRRAARVATRVFSPSHDGGAGGGTGGTRVVQNVLIPATPPRGGGGDDDSMDSSTDTEDGDEGEDGDGEGMEGVRLEGAAGGAAEGDSPAEQRPPRRAYWLQRVIRDAIYGRVWSGIVLLHRTPPSSEIPGAEWMITGERVAVKEMEWSRIRQHRGRLAENPINEVGALQFLMEVRDSPSPAGGAAVGGAAVAAATAAGGAAAATAAGGAAAAAAVGVAAGGAAVAGAAAGAAAGVDDARRRHEEEGEEARHVSTPLDMLSDERNLYVVSPYCDGGELFDLLEGAEKFSEVEARHWMGQILLGIGHLQRVGISHRDLSLENLLVHDRSCIVIDLGMCLRVPFERQSQQQQAPQSRPENGNAATAAGNARRRRRYLIPPQGTCGKWHYMSPEINANRDPFDGFAVDLWAAGVILFLMLTGFPPWEKACDSDDRFRYMSRGYMAQLLTEWQTGLTAEAMDLLQRMLYKDPRNRLTLSQVREHPWMMVGVGAGGGEEARYGAVPDRPFA